METTKHTATALIRRGDESRSSGMTIPDDLQRQAVKRLRVLAILYAGVFTIADFTDYVVDPDARIDSLDDWLPGVLSIAAALLVAWMASGSRFRPGTVLKMGLGLEVLGGFGIAMAEYWGLYAGLDHVEEHLELAGLSFVAVWMLLYTIVVPTRPRTALLASAATAAMVPLAFLLSVKYGGTSIMLDPAMFVGGLVMPYLLVVVMAYVGARVVYSLGSDVAKARRMGSYQLVEKLGQGGMGEVWRATHAMLTRPAVIKVVRPDVLLGSDPDRRDVVLQRFTREARATSSLCSPHTVELYDFGVTQEGTFYYVMELLDGLDLSDMIKEYGPLPAERVVYLLKQACHSLAEAHEVGLVHRDIKPANLYLCRYGREVDFIKVLDFGLVKKWQEDEPEAADPALTAENAVGGTPAFVSPEQALGGRVIDGRSDLYALGCVGYWLLTGELVFQGGTAMETMVMHAKETPVPPSQRTEMKVSSELERIILWCLEKDPNRRPQTADELVHALTAMQPDPTWNRDRALEWWGRYRPTATI